MKMTTTILMMGLVMAACAADAPRTAGDEQALVCDPNCDPGGAQPLINSVINAADGLGNQVPGSMLCHQWPAGCDPNPDGGGCIWHSAGADCSGIWQDPWGQQYLVYCQSNGGCGHSACGYPVPDQGPCR